MCCRAFFLFLYHIITPCVPGSKLHDDVPPMPGSKVAEVIQKELDAPPLEMFSNLNLSHPVGSASISQVNYVPDVNIIELGWNTMWGM